MESSYKPPRVILFLIGILNILIAFMITPSAQLFVVNQKHSLSLLIASSIILTLGFLMIISSLSLKIAAMLRVPALVLLVAELIAIGPTFGYSFLMAGAMAGDSGKMPSILGIVLFLSIPLLMIFIGFVFPARTIYKIGGIVPVSRGVIITTLVETILLAGVIYIGNVFFLQKQSEHLNSQGFHMLP
jgi:hypothetical protein